MCSTQLVDHIYFNPVRGGYCRRTSYASILGIRIQCGVCRVVVLVIVTDRLVSFASERVVNRIADAGWHRQCFVDSSA